MKDEQLFASINHIDSQYIQDAQLKTPKKIRRKIIWHIIAGVIALMLVIWACLPLVLR